jgi:glycosyltransferase involved in cell wall biosynthesis
VTACNNAAVLPDALRSVEQALDFLRHNGPHRDAPGEIIVVDDGSTDRTDAVLDAATRGKDFYRVLRRPRPTSPSAARNAGVAAARGELLFFLDADDLYLPTHLADCLAALADSAVSFAKTGVALPEPVHPDWAARIAHSVVINLCLRRACHDAVGGFFDYHLFVRDGEGFRHEADLFFKYEDQFYSELVARLFRGVGIARETVAHRRWPGNSFDRQYEKFRRPFGAVREELPPRDRLRLRLCEAVFEHRLRELTERLGTPPRWAARLTGGPASRLLNLLDDPGGGALLQVRQDADDAAQLLHQGRLRQALARVVPALDEHVRL